jgi:hypothetical protein
MDIMEHKNNKIKEVVLSSSISMIGHFLAKKLLATT